MSQPNPTTPAVDVAEGRRLWEELTAARAERAALGPHKADLASAERLAAAEGRLGFAAVHWAGWLRASGPALLDMIDTAASERDAAVREVEELKATLWRLENEGRYRIESIRSTATPWAVVDHKMNPPLIVRTFVTHLAAVEALHALASAAQGGAK